jgi:osmoprotectant transport system ATP-binding protein
MAAREVEFAHVSFDLPGGRRLLDDVSLKVEVGTTMALLGRSGSGKTTLLRTVNGLVRPTGGQVLVGGVNVGGVDLLPLRRGIGYVIQETGLFPHLTVERNVGMALELAGRPKTERRTRAVEMLRMVGLQEELGGRYPWQLSGGQRQRVGLARALVGEPEVLLMDEPFGALDPLTRAEMQDVLKQTLERVKTTVLIVTHDLQEALYLADHIAFIDCGKAVVVMRAADVMLSDMDVVRRYVAATTRRIGDEVQGV